MKTVSILASVLVAGLTFPAVAADQVRDRVQTQTSNRRRSASTAMS